jgi:hypothetical protein
MTDTHAIERTSPKGPGQKFIGTCRKCGKTGLTLRDINEPCENLLGTTQDDDLLAALQAQKDTDNAD